MDMAKKGFITIKRENDTYEILQQGWYKQQDYTESFFCENAIRVMACICPVGQTTTVQEFTEYKQNDEIFRAHPNYRQKGPWNDWAMI